MLSDATKSLPRKTNVRRKADDVGIRYSDQQKIELCQLYIITGNFSLACQSLNISPNTGKVWKRSDWWRQLEKELRVSEEMKLSARLKTIAEKALGVTQDRLENGDFKLNMKTGEVVRVPVGLKDAHKVAVDLISVTQEIDNKQVGPTQLEENINTKLDQLAQRFAELASKVQQKPPVVVTDVIEIEPEQGDGVEQHAIHDQRETRLEEAEEVGESPSC